MYIEYQLTIKDLGEAIQTHQKSIKLLMLIYMIILGLALLLAEEYRVWGFLIIIYNIYSFYFSQKNLIKQEWKHNKLLKEHR